MPKPSWREELGPQEFGLNLYEIFGEASRSYLFDDFAHHLSNLESVVTDSLAETSEKMKGAARLVPRDHAGVLDGNTAEFGILESFWDDHRELSARLRVIRNGIYLGAFAEFERMVREHIDCSNAHAVFKAAKPTLENYYSDADDLVRRIGELKRLRDELAHGGGSEREVTAKNLSPLLARKEINVADDGAIDFSDDFLPGALEDLRRASLATMRGVGPLRSQLREPTQ